MQYYLTRPETANKFSGKNPVINKSKPNDHWTITIMADMLANLGTGDVLHVYQASDIACSTLQMIEIMKQVLIIGATIAFEKSKILFHVEMGMRPMLDAISVIESDFVSKRTTEALARRKQAGLPLGRPKGRQNKSLKLDKFRDEIEKYMSLGVSKRSISKLVDCHPQTLYDWLDRKSKRTQEN